MPDENSRLDLIQRYAQRLKQKPGSAPIDDREAIRRVASPSGAARPPAPMEQARRAAPETPPSEPTREPIAVNFRELGRMGFLVPGAGKSALSEEFRNIKRPLIKQALAAGRDALRNGNLILVTSARPGEGKTFTAINLALSIASERDVQVLLVDADASTQGISTVFGLSAGPGLVDLLLDDALKLADVVLRTSVANLSILRAGCSQPDLPELLSSQRMSGLIHQLATLRSDQITIIDSPPLLIGAEAAVLASHVGQTLMVVEHNRTSCRFVDESLPKIDHCPSISFVMNRVDPMIWGQNLGDSYGYNGAGAADEN